MRGTAAKELTEWYRESNGANVIVEQVTGNSNEKMRRTNNRMYLGVVR